MPQLFFNNFRSTLAAACDEVQTTITLANAEGLPKVLAGDWFLLTLYTDDGANGKHIEVVRVTDIDGPDLTVERGVEGGHFKHGIGQPVEARNTAGTLSALEKRSRVAATIAEIAAKEYADELAGSLMASLGGGGSLNLAPPAGTNLAKWSYLSAESEWQFASGGTTVTHGVADHDGGNRATRIDLTGTTDHQVWLDLPAPLDAGTEHKAQVDIYVESGGYSGEFQLAYYDGGDALAETYVTPEAGWQTVSLTFTAPGAPLNDPSFRLIGYNDGGDGSSITLYKFMYAQGDSLSQAEPNDGSIPLSNAEVKIFEAVAKQAAEKAVLNAGTLDGIAASAFGRVDADNTWSGTNMTGPVTEAGAMRFNSYGGKFGMAPSNGGEWVYGDALEWTQAEGWDFGSVPKVNGVPLVLEGSSGDTSYVRADSSTTITAAFEFGTPDQPGSMRVYRSASATAGESEFRLLPGIGDGATAEWDYGRELRYNPAINGWEFLTAPYFNGSPLLVEGGSVRFATVRKDGAALATGSDVTLDTLVGEFFTISNDSGASTVTLANMPADAGASLRILVTGNAGLAFTNTVTWDGGSMPALAASWTILRLSHFPGDGWHGHVEASSETNSDGSTPEPSNLLSSEYVTSASDWESVDSGSTLSYGVADMSGGTNATEVTFVGTEGHQIWHDLGVALTKNEAYTVTVEAKAGAGGFTGDFQIAYYSDSAVQNDATRTLTSEWQEFTVSFFAGPDPNSDPSIRLIGFGEGVDGESVVIGKTRLHKGSA